MGHGAPNLIACGVCVGWLEVCMTLPHVNTAKLLKLPDKRPKIPDPTMLALE